MKHGPKSLLAFLRFRGGRSGQCWWKQSRIAEELGCSRRSVVRWVAELVADGWLESVRRGGRENLYSLRKTCEKQRSLPLEPVTSDVTTCHISRPAYKTVGSFKKQEKLAMPAPFVENEYGRRIENPVFRKVQEAFRRARERIERARCPEAYAQAILRAELAA